MPWQCALILPDTDGGWSWAGRGTAGLPALVRIVISLRRAGVERVLLSPGGERLRPLLQSWEARRDLPDIVGWEDASRLAEAGVAPLLVVRGGVLFDKRLPGRFRDWLDGRVRGKAVTGPQAPPVLVSLAGSDLAACAGTPSLEALAEGPDTESFTIPEDVFCRSVAHLAGPGRDRELLDLVGKPTDRWHVRWVRGWTFPALRLLADSRVTPNQITVFGFLVAASACALIASGGYWKPLTGALLLYASWVLDCVDGTLARLTCAESEFGGKLDTTLGHLTNLMVFSALVWSVFGGEPRWKASAAALAALGGITAAHLLVQAGSRRRAPSGAQQPRGGIQLFLDKINHRDYAVWIFLFALIGNLKAFLWLSLVGIQLFWAAQLWLLLSRRPG